MPFGHSDLDKALSRVRRLDDAQLQHLQRFSCGLETEWAYLAHTLSHAVSDWPRMQAHAIGLCAQWSASVRRYAPDQLDALSALQAALDGSELHPIRSAIQALEEGLCHASDAGTNLPILDASTSYRPHGYDALLVADDQGYELSTIAQLESLGYSVKVARLSLDAEALLEWWQPRVVLVDLHFPTAEAGLALMRRAVATPSVALVIAISRSRIAPGILPEGVVDCSGGLDFQDADRIHRIIWRRALGEAP